MCSNDPEVPDATSQEASPIAVPAPVSPIRFCGACGAPWDPAWTQCPHCIQRQISPPGGEAYRQDLGAVKSAVTLYFALLAVSVVAILSALRSDEGLSATAEMAFDVVFSLITVAWCIGRRNELWPLLTQPFAPIWLVVGAIGAISTYLLASVVLMGLEAMGFHTLTYGDSYALEGYGFAWVILSICIQPAIFEELAFRGVIQSALAPVLGRIEAVIVTAMVFGILHLSVPSLPHLVILGLVLGWLRMMTGSLYAGMLMHFTHNLLVVLSERSGGGILPW